MTEEKFVLVFPKAFEKARNFIFSRYKIDHSTCEDILQNASLKAFKNLKSFQEKSSFDSWFISILINEVKNFFLSQKKSNIIDNSDVNLENYSFICEEPEITKKEKEEFVSYLLSESLSRLSEKHKIVIDLLLKDKSPLEISKKLRIPISSVRTRTFYAKKNLKQIISSYAFDSKS